MIINLELKDQPIVSILQWKKITTDNILMGKLYVALAQHAYTPL